MAGSAVALVTETLGFSSARLERNVEVAVVDDENAYLGLVDGELVDSGILFDDDAGVYRSAPQLFDVKNQLTETLTRVTLEVETFRFLEGVDAPDGTTVEIEDDGRRLVATGLEPGTAIEDITIALPDVGKKAEDTIEIQAAGKNTFIRAQRTLRLEASEPETEFDVGFLLCRGRSDNCVSVFVTFGTEEVEECEDDEGDEQRDGDDDEVESGDGSDDATEHEGGDEGCTPDATVERTLVEIDVESGEEPTRTRGTLEAGESKTFDLEFGDFGGSGAGNWNVTWAEPNPDPAPDTTKPGESVTVEFGNITTTIDPDGTGPPQKTVVSVTVTVDE